MTNTYLSRCRPCLTSSVLGLFNIAYTITTRHSSPPHFSASALAALTLSALSTLFYTILTIHTAFKVDRVRARDTNYRHRADSESINLLPEDEQQRQQLLRLLMAREGKKSSSDASTFRIDLPDNLRRSGATYLQAPQHTYEARQGRSLSGWHLPVPERFSFSANANGETNQTRDLSYPQSGLSPPLLHSYSSETTPQIPYSHSHESTSPIPDIIQPPYADSSSPEPPVFVTPSYSPLGSSHSPVHTTISYPAEKVAQQLSPLQDVHPLERHNQYYFIKSNLSHSLRQGRNNYRRIDQQADEESTYRMMDEPTEEERRRSASRESRRAEIERGGKSAGKSKGAEDVEVIPRIVRVETDGFGRV